MYETIEKLVKENKLSFADNHQTEAKYLLENDTETFLEQVQMNCMFSDGSKKKYPIFRGENCSHCGERIRYYLEGEELVPYHIEALQLVPTDTICTKEDEVVVEIPVPSGELLFADWFLHATELIGHLDKKSYEINFPKVKIQRSKDYANEGMGHFFVGGSSPSVFQNENNILIGSHADREAKTIGSIQTELWWVSICDRKVYEQMAIKTFGDEKGKEMTAEALQHAKENHAVAKVTPGTYRLRYFTDIHDDTPAYATLEKVNDSVHKEKE